MTTIEERRAHIREGVRRYRVENLEKCREKSRRWSSLNRNKTAEQLFLSGYVNGKEFKTGDRVRVTVELLERKRKP